MDPINLAQKLTLFSEHWTPKIIGELNDSYVKVAKFKGEFVWHKHEEDELFLLLHGSFALKLRDRDIPLTAGELFIVPAGVEHCPVADDEAHVLLLEPKTIRNTGDAESPLTVEDPDWI